MSSLLLATGDDLLLLDEAVRALGAELAAAALISGPLERVELRGDQLGELAAMAATGSLFGNGTLLVVRDLATIARGAEAKRRLTAIFAALAPGNGIAFLDPKRRRPNPRDGEGGGELGALVRAAGGRIVTALSPTPGELAPWLRERARSMGREITLPAASLLAERLGAELREPDVDRRALRLAAGSELAKLMLAIPEGPIYPGAVRALVADRQTGSLFAFADAIVARNGEQIARHLSRALAEPGPVVVTTLHRRLRDLIALHGGLRLDGRSVSEIAAEQGIHEFVAGKLAAVVSRWEQEELISALEGLVTIDAIAKGAAPGDYASALTRWSAAQAA
jgi:DNA polymerase III delta subunit